MGLGREADDLIVASDRLALADVPHCNLVPGRTSLGRRHAVRNGRCSSIARAITTLSAG